MLKKDKMRKIFSGNPIIKMRSLIGTNMLSSQFEKIIDIAPGYIYWLDVNQVCFGCNSSFAKTLGFDSKHEMLEKHIFDWRIQESLIETIYNNNQKVLRIDSPIEHNFEEPLYIENAEKIMVLSHKRKIFDVKNKLVGMLNISLDITKKNKIQAFLEQEKDRTDMYFENILANLPGNVWWLDKNNIFQGCNDSQAKLAGLNSRHEIVGKSNYDMPWKESADDFNKINNQVMKDGVGFTVEENIKDSIYLSTKAPFYDKNGNITGTLGIALDITERKKMEFELKQAKELAEISNKTKTKFIRNMEHDIRTPISGILGMTELLSASETDTVKKQIISDISYCTQELMKYCLGILDYSKIEADESPVSSKKFNLYTLIDSVYKIESPAAKIKQLNLSVQIDPEVPEMIMGDEYRLKGILINLLSNAIKFTEKGYVELSIKLIKKTPKKIILDIIVTDSGIGIPAKKIEFIYEKFSRLSPSNQGVYRGLGLGLRIVKQFVQEMEGEITVKSAVGKGTCFTCTFQFELPLANMDI